MDDVFVEKRGKYEVYVREYSDEIKPMMPDLEFAKKAYAIINEDTGVLEFETVHYFNVLRYIADSMVQEVAWDKSIDNSIITALSPEDQSEEGRDYYKEVEESLLSSLGEWNEDPDAR